MLRWRSTAVFREREARRARVLHSEARGGFRKSMIGLNGTDAESGLCSDDIRAGHGEHGDGRRIRFSNRIGARTVSVQHRVQFSRPSTSVTTKVSIYPHPGRCRELERVASCEAESSRFCTPAGLPSVGVCFSLRSIPPVLHLVKGPGGMSLRLRENQ